MSASDKSDLTRKFIAELEECLKNDDRHNAVLLFKDNTNEQIIEQSSWDIIPMISSYLTSTNAANKKNLFECCEVILCIIAEKCDPSEIVLQFLEQIESLEDDVKFCAMLNPIGITFNRMNDKSRAVEWCVSTIQSYIQDLPIPMINKSNSNIDNITEETNTDLCRIVKLYQSIILFVESLIKEINVTNITTQDLIVKDYILGLLMYLLGKPYCYLHEDTVVLEVKIGLLLEKILKLMLYLTKDIFYFLNFVNNRLELENYTMSDKDKGKEIVNTKKLRSEIFNSQEIVPNLAYANLFFYIITKNFIRLELPQIYNPHYIFQTCIYLVNCLLKEQNTTLIAKGLLFMEHLVKLISKQSIDLNMLELKIYTALLDTIINVMIYCDSNSDRKKALSIFHEYIKVFDMEAKYFIILHLYNTCNHSGVLSIVTGLLKTSIIETLEATSCNTYFSGSNLESLLKHACNLPHQSATDVVEMSDEIITTLNLLRFLLIRDQSNETGIWDIIHKLQETYLNPLRQGIYLCRAHWQTKIKDLEEEGAKTKNKTQKLNETEIDKKVMLSIGGEKLPAMPIAQKVNFSHQVLCGLDVMESLVIRVNECIKNNPATNIS